MKKQNKNDYEVGYGRPPKGHQWQPGQSGNPSGKKRKSPSLLTDALITALQTKVAVQQGGQTKKMTTNDVVAQTLIKTLIKGTPKDQVMLLKALDELGVFQKQVESSEEADHGDGFTEEHRRLLAIAKADVFGPDD
jgi:hypothetical protein